MITRSESVFKTAYSAPIGYTTMTSVPVHNKTSQSRKQCMLEIKFLLISLGKCCFLSKSVIESCIQRPIAELSRTHFSSLLIKTVFCWKRCMIGEHCLTVLPNSVCENYWKHPRAIKKRWHQSNSTISEKERDWGKGDDQHNLAFEIQTDLW